ncbi:MAG: T9SS type A sorting domain-containing protein, partial [Bacteroidetes bacterium]|nr:T9SS type A sorting domain-containing protein [Bacteroidota bacterium]
FDDGSCLELDACGICDGPGAIYECGCADIPAGDCDCDGNQLDALGVCGGDCAADEDADGICDDVDDCVGSYDACGVCNGPGEIYECGCADIPAGDCDCDGNQLDALGVCGGDCAADADSDGICDDVDDCVGSYDACGVCNGPGEIYECGCADIPAGDCDCDGNQLDVVGVCGGDCTVDADSDGICDDVDDCVGAYDACGVCNGPGEIYECGCSDIPAGDCDCDGNQLDALGVCGGDCEADDNQNGICDVDDVGGCIDNTNPGYDPGATFDDGSCLAGGCTITTACNYDPDADYQLAGSCNFTTCAGCTNVLACNFDPEATLNNGSCVYAQEYYDCDGVCENDEDGDGLCDEFEVFGCMEPSNPAYNPAATEDDGSCLIPGCLLPAACNYDPDADFIIIGLCDFESCAGCTNPGACNFDPTATLNDAGSCEFPAISFLDCDGNCENDTDGDGICNEQEIPGCTDEGAVNFNPYATDDNGTCIVLSGGCVLPFACNFDPEADFYIPGSCDFSCLFGTGDGDCNNEMACNYGASDEPCVFFDEEGNTCVLGGCTVDVACNYSEEAVYNDGSCEYSTCQVFGCNAEAACNYDAEVTVNDGSCDFTSCSNTTVLGCTIPMACNFNPEATTNDSTCDFTSCFGFGCTDVEACNYDVDALINDGSCVQEVAGFDCDGNCVVDEDGDGVCDMNEVGGCTDMGANNFDPNATDNNGSCTYDMEGCMDIYACNFNYVATVDNGSCDFECYGCMNPNACNFDAEATLHDYSVCSYMFTYALQGSTDVSLEEETSYEYTWTSGSTYEWVVEGGVIVEGQGTHQIEVVWLLETGLIAVQETNIAGCLGDWVSVIVTGAASELEEGVSSFTSYPNPANDVVVIEISGFEANAFQLVDASGRVVMSERLIEGRNVLSVAHLANGTYRMVVTKASGREIRPLVVAR